MYDQQFSIYWILIQNANQRPELGKMLFVFKPLRNIQYRYSTVKYSIQYKQTEKECERQMAYR